MTDKTIKTELVYYSIKTGLKADLLKALGEIPFSTWKVDMVYPNGTANAQGRKFRESLLRKLGIDLSKAHRSDDFIYSREVNLEVQHLFADQWNSVEGFRLFNKVEFVRPNKSICEGFYLQQTPEMVEALRGTAKCRYCGHQAPVGEKDFCDKCLGSAHLKESDLHLLRMEPIELPEYRTSGAEKRRTVQPLTEGELGQLMPKYVAAQASLRAKEEAATRKALLRDFEKETSIAETKYKGTLWILDAGVSIENMIFYPHEMTFTFGWRNPLSEAVKEAITKKMEGFPYTYRFK